MYTLAFSGGGIRALASIGALLAAEQAGIPLTRFQAFTGNSSGALLAAMLASGWRPLQMAHAVVQAPFSTLLSPLPWQWRRNLVVVKPVQLAGLTRWLASLNLVPTQPLLINAWNCETNRQTLYTNRRSNWQRTPHVALKTDWSEEGITPQNLPTVLARSMALPGLLADHPRWMDGALGEHPPLEAIPTETPVVLINLGYAGLLSNDLADTIPRSILQRALYAYEVTATINQKRAFSRLSNLIEIQPRIYDVDSTAFDLSPKEKWEIILRGYRNTLFQWQQYNKSQLAG